MSGNRDRRDGATSTKRKQLRAVNARQDDIVQVCFETTDEVWAGIKSCRPEIMDLQEFVTLVLERAAPKADLSKACVNPSHSVPRPPVYVLGKKPTKVRCFKTKRVVWGLMVLWAAISGNDLKELLSGVIWAYVKKDSKRGKGPR